MTGGQTATRSFVVSPANVPAVTYASPTSVVSAAGGTTITMRVKNFAPAPSSVVYCGSTVTLNAAAVSTGINAYELSRR